MTFSKQCHGRWLVYQEQFYGDLLASVPDGWSTYYQTGNFNEAEHGIVGYGTVYQYLLHYSFSENNFIFYDGTLDGTAEDDVLEGGDLLVTVAARLVIYVSHAIQVVLE